MKIAIDGPSGVGKSTLAKAVANEFNLLYIDTGAMYRMVALFFFRNNLDYENEQVVEKNLPYINLVLDFKEGARFFLNGEDVTNFLRTQDISQISSCLAQLKCVRDKLTDLQKKIAAENNVIMDGRDIASNIMPDADLKFYLDANPLVRTKRRMLELELREENYTWLYNQILERDEKDLKRKFSPLTKVNDAILIDTSNMNFEDVKRKVFEFIKIKMRD